MEFTTVALASIALINNFIYTESVTLKNNVPNLAVKHRNRKLQASIASHNWPTSRNSAFCEVFGYFDSDPSVTAENNNDSKNENYYTSWKFRYLGQLLENIASTKSQNAQNVTSFAEGADIALAAVSHSFIPHDDNNGVSNFEDTFDAKMLPYALSLRAHAPLCEMHRVLARAAAIDLGLFQGFGKNGGSIDQSDDGKMTTPEVFGVVEGTSRVALTPEDMVQFFQQENSKDSNVGEKSDALPDWASRLPGETPHYSSEIGVEMGTKSLLLYGNVDTVSFASSYNMMVENNIPFIVRHMGAILFDVDDNIEAESLLVEKTVLQGYGVRLDIRNVEYKMYDDKPTVDDILDEEQETNENKNKELEFTNDFLAGINPSILSKRFLESNKHGAILSSEAVLRVELEIENIQAQLIQFHHYQSTHAQKIPPNWKRSDLSLQAVEAISSSYDPLEMLQELSQNLPSYASKLVDVDVPTQLREIAEEYHHMSNEKDGAFDFFINGKGISVDRPSFNLFELINVLREENAFLTKLKVHLSEYLSCSETNNDLEGLTIVRSILEMGKIDGNENEEEDVSDGLNPFGASPPESNLRIDVGRGHGGGIIYINNIEKDIEYQGWPRDPTQMVYALQFGARPTVRKNLLNILLIIDPFSANDEFLEVIMSLAQMIQGRYPIRVGFLFVSDTDIAACRELNIHNFGEDIKSCIAPQIIVGNIDNKDDVMKSPATVHTIFHMLKYVAKTYDTMTAFTYSYHLIENIQKLKMTRSDLIIADLVMVHFQALNEKYQDISKSSIVEFLKDVEADNRNDKLSLYSKALTFAVNKNVKPKMTFVNGIPVSSTAKNIEHTIMEEINYIAGLVMTQKITSSFPKSIYGMLLSGSNVYTEMHPLLTESKGAYHFSFPGKNALSYPSNQNEFDLDFIKKTTDSAVFLVEGHFDFESEMGLTLLLSFLSVVDNITGENDYITKFGKASIAYRILPSTIDSAKSFIATLFQVGHKLEKDELISVIELVKRIIESGKAVDGIQDLVGISKKVETILAGVVEDKVCANSHSFSKKVSSSTVNSFITVNGRIFVPNGSSILKNDLVMLMTLEHSTAKVLTQKLGEQINATNAHDSIGHIAAFVGETFSSSDDESQQTSTLSLYEDLRLKSKTLDNDSFYYVWNDDEEHTDELKIKVTAILDPLSEATQRVAPLLRHIRDQLKLSLTLILLPRPNIKKTSSLPLASYYRFVADPFIELEGKNPKALFEDLPTNHLLTIRMDVPEQWDIQQTYSVQDTDNLLCEEQKCGDDEYGASLVGKLQRNDDEEDLGSIQMTTVEYGLRSLLFFGRCYETSTVSPPNGLELTLSGLSSNISLSSADLRRSETAEILADGSVKKNDASKTTLELDSHTLDGYFSDTIVMKNLGYWQLRANAGVWKLNIAEHSKGFSIFEMVDGKILSDGSMKKLRKSSPIVMKSLVMKDFVNKGQTLLVRRKEGFENTQLLKSEDEEENNVDDETIHVFSLATGHLYERFLKIMMLSVVKRTSVPVKFWLFENFLSPTFKSSALSMAKKIGCDLEFVTYKWPEWLRGQSEKQRIIWGYKILFLDVLFPLNLKKIIYVDADQVVRGDLKELWDMDLEGAPYGYTPFCDSREETLGYQFWRSGFWATHLQGKPYHISALYVVDLQRFRRELVGDKLRGIYQQLSADPTSLSNLDQDLPNYAQHQVRIFSLPQEWLWCESWCSDDTKVISKTIDLCNNPEHKEPKVSMAKRIISGELFEESWIELDSEVDHYDQDYYDSINIL